MEVENAANIVKLTILQFQLGNWIFFNMDFQEISDEIYYELSRKSTAKNSQNNITSGDFYKLNACKSEI